MSHIRLDRNDARLEGRAARRGFRPVVAAIALAVGAGLAAPAGARPLPAECAVGGSAVVVDEASKLVVVQQGEQGQQRGPVSLEQAQQRALARFAGRVAGAKTVEQGGRKVHEIRIIGEDNLVRTFRIDAQTGAFL